MKRTKDHEELEAVHAFRETLARAGVPDSHLEVVAREFERAAAAHQWLAHRHLTQGSAPSTEAASSAIETWCRHIAKDYPSIQGFNFLSDPRGGTVGLQLASGDSNSLTGTWKVPVREDDLTHVRLKDCTRYTALNAELAEFSPQAPESQLQP